MSGDVPHLAGVLTSDEAVTTAARIASLQLPSGMIPWVPGGHCDPWNHVETAMALAVTGHRSAAERAYRWLARTQRNDGSWHNYYRSDGSVEDAKLDTNVCAYVATGIWHHWLVTGDEAFVEQLWPTVQRALDWVLDLQTPRGEIVWAREVESSPWTYALLTGSSSIFHSLRCGAALAQALGDARPDWELAADRLGEIIRQQPDAFAPKHRWAMDWYYPVLTGVVTGRASVDRLASARPRFVMAGLGVRCVDDEPWVTAAETAECALAHAVAGQRQLAIDLLVSTRAHRADDGSYATGIVYPSRVTFPDQEHSAYSAAAVLLAVDAIGGTSAASGLFLSDPLAAFAGPMTADGARGAGCEPVGQPADPLVD